MDTQEKCNYLRCFAGYAFDHGILESDKEWMREKSKTLRQKYADCHTPMMVIHDLSTEGTKPLANKDVFVLIFKEMIPHIRDVPMDSVVHKVLEVKKALVTVELSFNVNEAPGNDVMIELVQKMIGSGGQPFVIYVVNDTTQKVSAAVMDFCSTTLPEI